MREVIKVNISSECHPKDLSQYFSPITKANFLKVTGANSASVLNPKYSPYHPSARYGPCETMIACFG